MQRPRLDVRLDNSNISRDRHTYTVRWQEKVWGPLEVACKAAPKKKGAAEELAEQLETRKLQCRNNTYFLHKPAI